MLKVDAKWIITGVMNFAFLIDRTVSQFKDGFMRRGSASISHGDSPISIRPRTCPFDASVRHKLRVKFYGSLRPIVKEWANINGVISCSSFFIVGRTESALYGFAAALFDDAFHTEAPLCG